MARRAALLPLAALLLTACGGSGEGAGGDAPASIRLTSTAFSAGGQIPARFTCDGEDIAPPLAWGNVPADAGALALVMTDPDAPGGTFTHWTIWNIPAAATGFAEGLAPATVVVGENSFGRLGYGGPCPPPTTSHRYVFRLLALRDPLALGEGATPSQVTVALRSAEVLARGELIGRYGRPG